MGGGNLPNYIPGKSTQKRLEFACRQTCWHETRHKRGTEPSRPPLLCMVPAQQCCLQAKCNFFHQNCKQLIRYNTVFFPLNSSQTYSGGADLEGYWTSPRC